MQAAEKLVESQFKEEVLQQRARLKEVNKQPNTRYRGGGCIVVGRVPVQGGGAAAESQTQGGK